MVAIKERIPVTAVHALDAIDMRAAHAAARYCDENGHEIATNPAESATRLFDELGQVYERRKVHRRVVYGDELVDVTYIGTRTPDTTAIDEIYSEFAIHDNSPDLKVPLSSTQRAVTMLDGRGGWRRIVLSGGELHVYDHNQREVTGTDATAAVFDFVLRTNQAIATYRGRSAEQQYEADIDAKEKLRQYDIYEQRGVNVGSYVMSLLDKWQLDKMQSSVV